jgi:hypothetical protein
MLSNKKDILKKAYMFCNRQILYDRSVACKLSK